MTGSREQAARVLGIPPDATAGAARAGFARLLRAEGFLPPEAAVAAANLLAGTALPVTPVGDDLVAGEVAAFAGAFWSLPPADRRARWIDLAARATAEANAARLLALEPGLGVEVGKYEDPAAGDLAACARELFLLEPRARAVRRAEWLASRAYWVTALFPAGKRVRDADPALVSLDPPLFELCGYTVAAVEAAVKPRPDPAAAREFQEPIAGGERAGRRNYWADEWKQAAIMAGFFAFLLFAIYSFFPRPPAPGPTGTSPEASGSHIFHRRVSPATSRETTDQKSPPGTTRTSTTGAGR
jgi:hypothetical protein